MTELTTAIDSPPVPTPPLADHPRPAGGPWSVIRRPSSALARLAADQRLVMAALFSLGLALRLWDIGQRGFWLDELSAVGTSALDFEALRQALTVEANMTLYYWALFVWLRVVGFAADEAAIRLLSAVVGAAVVPLVYLLGRRLHSPAAGLAAGGLLAVNGFHVLMSQEARAYAVLSFFTVLSFILLDRAVTGGRRRDWALHGLVTTLAFYCHFYTAFTVLAQGLFVLSRRSRPALLGLVASGLIMFLLTAQLIPFFIRQSGGAKLGHVMRPNVDDVVRFFVDFSGGSRPTLLLYGLLAGLGLVLLRGGTRRSEYRAWLLLSWFCLPVGLALAISTIRPIFEDRYLFATLPALALLAGLGLARLPRPAALLAFGAFAFLSVGALQGDFQVRRNEQWREAVAYALAGAQPDDGWIFVSKWGQNGFEYYAGWQWGRNPAAPYGDIFEPFDWQEAFKVPKYRGVQAMENLDRFAAGHPRIWLVLSHEYDATYDGDMGKPVRDRLSRRYEVLQQRQYRGVRAMLYQRRGASS